MKISRKFATSLDILVAKGTNLIANATVLVAISSPGTIKHNIVPGRNLPLSSGPLIATERDCDY